MSDLVVTISNTFPDNSMENLLIDIYSNIFAYLTNLKYLDLNVDNTYSTRRPLLSGLSSTTYFSANTVHLRIRMHDLDDCLCLLDGRLSQLQTFIIDLDYIYDTFNGMHGRRPLSTRQDPLNMINNSVNKLPFHFILD